jgi:poly-gamma-glutamate synthesis protein (capsule biosynthesis protein)
VDDAYVWGDALAELERARPDARIANLETSVTTSEDAWPGKGIHYRMHPANAGCLTAAGIDCCVLANNHVLDWGRAGLGETLDTLHAAGLRTAGAGRDAQEAAAPAAIALPGAGRVLVFATAMESSGVSPDWAARPKRAGVDFLPDLSPERAKEIAHRVALHRRPGDLVVFSIHWGGNWGYRIEPEERAFAHALVEVAGVDVVHGHSSHHAKGIEVHAGRPILYGCGDFLNDYESIGGNEAYRPELSLMYFPALEPGSGALRALTLVPMRIRRLRVERAGDEAGHWLAKMLSREGRGLGTAAELAADGTLALRWK